MLALALGRTVGELQASMTHSEFGDWAEFYRRWPFDDFHRFHRPAALIAASGVKYETQQEANDAIEWRLEWLQPKTYAEGEHVPTSADLDLFRAAGVKR